jgi:hypothetical protein
MFQSASHIDRQSTPVGYGFIAVPGAAPHRIAFDVSGAKPVRGDAQGDLVFNLGEKRSSLEEQMVYQEEDGTWQSIAANYFITAANRIGFERMK